MVAYLTIATFLTTLANPCQMQIFSFSTGISLANGQRRKLIPARVLSSSCFLAKSFTLSNMALGAGLCEIHSLTPCQSIPLS